MTKDKVSDCMAYERLCAIFPFALSLIFAGMLYGISTGILDDFQKGHIDMALIECGSSIIVFAMFSAVVFVTGAMLRWGFIERWGST